MRWLVCNAKEMSAQVYGIKNSALVGQLELGTPLWVGYGQEPGLF